MSLNGYGCRCDRYQCGILYFSFGLISTPRPAPTGQIMVHIAPKHISGLQGVARSDSCSHRGRPLGPGPAIIHHHHPGRFWSRPRGPDKILANGSRLGLSPTSVIPTCGSRPVSYECAPDFACLPRMCSRLVGGNSARDYTTSGNLAGTRGGQLVSRQHTRGRPAKSGAHSWEVLTVRPR